MDIIRRIDTLDSISLEEALSIFRSRSIEPVFNLDEAIKRWRWSNYSNGKKPTLILVCKDGCYTRMQWRLAKMVTNTSRSPLMLDLDKYKEDTGIESDIFAYMSASGNTKIIWWWRGMMRVIKDKESTYGQELPLGITDLVIQY